MTTPPSFHQLRSESELAGPWRFQLDRDDRGEAERWYEVDFDRSQWATVAVGQPWDFYDHALWGYEGVGWFATEIPAGLVDRGRWQRLCLACVGTHARVWLNGRLLGEGFGRYLPLELAATPSLHQDGPNLLVVRVDNAYRPEWLPGGDVVEWVQYGGLLRPVWLIATAPVLIAGFAIAATPVEAGASVRCEVEVANHSPAAFTGRVRVEVPIDPAPASVTVPVGCEPGSVTTASLKLDLAAAHPWSPDTPVLYQARASVMTADSVLDAVVERFGIRSLEVRGTDLLLNGQPLRIRGVNRYDEYGGYGPSAPADLIRADLLRIKQAGINLIRTHYPQDPLHHTMMDEIGLLLLEEVPLNWWPTTPGPGQTPELAAQRAGVIELAEQALEAMIRRDRNHPCVVAWSIANECATHTPTGIAAMRRLLRRARALDPTRPATFAACGPIEENEAFAEADLVAANLYYGVFGGEPAYHAREMDERVRRPTEERLRQLRARFPEKPLLVTEFGTQAVAGLHGDARFTEEYQAAYIEAAWKAIQAVPGVLGGVLWCWADYFHRQGFLGPLGVAYGPYGVVTIDRRPKSTLANLTRLFGGS